MCIYIQVYTYIYMYVFIHAYFFAFQISLTGEPLPPPGGLRLLPTALPHLPPHGRVSEHRGRAGRGPARLRLGRASDAKIGRPGGPVDAYVLPGGCSIGLVLKVDMDSHFLMYIRLSILAPLAFQRSGHGKPESSGQRLSGQMPIESCEILSDALK